MRPRSLMALIGASAVPVLMVLATTAGESQTVSSPRATLGDCPGSTLVASDEEVTLDREGSLESSSGLLCRYTSSTGYYKPFIEIHWTSDDSSGSDEAGACELGPGDVVKTGLSWKSRERKVQAAWSSGIALTGGAGSEQKLIGGLVRRLEGMGVGAPCFPSSAVIAAVEDDDCPHFEARPGITVLGCTVIIDTSADTVLDLSADDLPPWIGPLIATVGDLATCVGPRDTLITGDESVLFNGRPIARLGDRTAHGGVIVEGDPRLIINGKLAARLGGMHICPMVNPGPVPHVGGPILDAESLNDIVDDEESAADD